MTTPQAAAPPALAELDAMLTELLFGWKWYRLTRAGCAQAMKQDELDGKPNRAHLYDGDRFLADPTYGDVQIREGRFELASTGPTARGYEHRVLPISQNLGISIIALEKFPYISYKRHGEDHIISCSRGLGDGEMIGKGEASTFPEAVVWAIARALRLVPIVELQHFPPPDPPAPPSEVIPLL